MTTPDTGGPGQVLNNISNLLNTAFNRAQTASSFGGWFTNNRFSFGNINPLNPPKMRTFVYSPEVRAIIDHGGVQYDVSDDIVSCSLTRPERSAASFAMTLHNKGSRYTPMDRMRFTPMDRIVVYMKKTGWQQVFAGYLDSVPFRQLYPGTVEITATCTIKRLMHQWWNPNLAESQQWLSQPLAQLMGLSGNDNGLGGVLGNLLTVVGGWNPMDIHIQDFPIAFLEWLMDGVKLNNREGQVKADRLRRMVLGNATLVAPRAYADANPNAGTPGPTMGATGAAGTLSLPGVSATTLFYITQIVAACDEKGLGPQVIDNNVGAGMVKAGEVGGGGSADLGGNQSAWGIILETGLNWQTTNRNTDGAILGVAAAMVDSGGDGTSIKNCYNPGVPGSDAFVNDGPRNDGTAVGIFGQQNYTEWGNLSQRMNPKQAAGMFMAELASISGWRNLEPGQAIQMVQRTASADAYSSAVELAKTIVQAYRTSMASQISTVLPGGGSMGTSAGSVASQIPGMSSGDLGAVSTSGVQIPGSAAIGTLSPTRENKPQPDSEGAINWARTQCGMPYEWGAAGPSSYDCSGLIQQAFRAIGVAIPRTTYEMIRSNISRIYPQTSVQRGDIVCPDAGHVVLWAGETIIEAQGEGVPVHEVPAATIGAPGDWAWVGRACANGGNDPTAPYNPPQMMGPGNPPSAVTQISAGNTGGTTTSQEGIALNLFSYIYGGFDSVKATLFSGRKAFIDGQPLINAIQSVAAAGLRSWSSGPDGSFIAWYPDYWGLDGKPAVLVLEDIELKDCRIDLSDDPLTTHVYVLGNLNQWGLPDDAAGWLETAGVVTVEDPDMWLWQRLAQVVGSDDGITTGSQLLRRYGIRPIQRQYTMAGSLELEFLIAAQVFMEKWAERFSTTISMTFMPELFPGMRVKLGQHNVEVYVTSVTHTCNYSQGFYTQATIVAPATPWAKQAMEATQTPGWTQDTEQSRAASMSWLAHTQGVM